MQAHHYHGVSGVKVRGKATAAGLHRYAPAFTAPRQHGSWQRAQLGHVFEDAEKAARVQDQLLIAIHGHRVSGKLQHRPEPLCSSSVAALATACAACSPGLSTLFPAAALTPCISPACDRAGRRRHGAAQLWAGRVSWGAPAVWARPLGLRGAAHVRTLLQLLLLVSPVCQLFASLRSQSYLFAPRCIAYAAARRHRRQRNASELTRPAAHLRCW